jgi:hypothetical protein
VEVSMLWLWCQTQSKTSPASTGIFPYLTHALPWIQTPAHPVPAALLLALLFCLGDCILLVDVIAAAVLLAYTIAAAGLLLVYASAATVIVIVYTIATSVIHLVYDIPTTVH